MMWRGKISRWKRRSRKLSRRKKKQKRIRTDRKSYEELKRLTRRLRKEGIERKEMDEKKNYGKRWSCRSQAALIFVY